MNFNVKMIAHHRIVGGKPVVLLKELNAEESQIPPFCSNCGISLTGSYVLLLDAKMRVVWQRITE